MIFFQLPNLEQLYTTNGDFNTSEITFFPFDKKANKVSLAGSIIPTNTLAINTSLSNIDIIEVEDKEEYIQSIRKVIETINENKLPKLVFSRRKVIKYSNINLEESFRQLSLNYPNAFRYIFEKNGECWMGAFSEVLGKFNKITNSFETMSLAGTLPLEQEWTTKEIEEQKPVTTYIEQILYKYSVDVEKSETYNHTSGNIKHLRTDFKALIKPNDLDEIIDALHPTPAVCGIPKDFCTSKILEFEKYPRELYAGYIKVEMPDYIYYFVNLRCSKIYKNHAQIIVGGGITSQSDPLKEWIETELKSEAIANNLVIF